MKFRISATKAARSFSDLINRVHYRGEIFIIERGGEPICHIIPTPSPKCTVTDFIQLLHNAPKPDDEFLQLIEDLTQHQPSLPPNLWS